MKPIQSELPRRLFPAVGLLSLAVLMLQIALNRIFSYTSWHHLAYISVSLALLGFGASGSVLAAFPGLGGRSLARGVALQAALAALGVVVALGVLGAVPLDLGAVLSSPRELGVLALYFTAVTLPFFSAGLAIALALRDAGREVGRLYFFDLVGAGVGCALVVPAMNALETPHVLCVVALAFALAGLLAAGPRAGALGALCAATATLFAVLAVAPLPGALAFAPSSDKLIAPWLRDGVLHYSRWGALFRTDMVGGRGAESTEGGYRAGGLSPYFKGVAPAFRLIFHDGTAGALLYRVTGAPGEFEMFRHHVMTTPYLVAPPRPEVLVIGLGGDADVVNALENGAARVDGVELDPLTVDLITRRYADYTGHLFDRPDVQVHSSEGRHFVRSTRRRFDLVQMTGVDTLAALTGGAYILAENYLYTVDAWQDYFRVLRDGGLLSVAAVDFSPAYGYSRHALRFASLSRAALEARGVERPADHILVLSEPRGIAQFEVLTRLRPFSDAEIQRVLDFAEAEGLEPWYLPRQPRHQLLPFRLLLESSPQERARFLDDTFLDLRPTTDDRPFFFSFYKWRNLLAHRDEIDPGHMLATGQLVLVLILGLSIAFSAVAILLPLWRSRPAASLPGRSAFLAYFASLGAGFIFAEISFVQRFLLFLGYPLYALSVILFSFLAAAGVGAHLSSRLPDAPRRVLPALALALTALVALYHVAIPLVFGSFLASGLALRVVLTVALCAPLGGLLGTFFPYGLRLLAAREREFTAWAWAVNGCLTVVGSVGAVMLAMRFGFETVIWLFLAIYWVGVAAFVRGDAQLARAQRTSA